MKVKALQNCILQLVKLAERYKRAGRDVPQSVQRNLRIQRRRLAEAQR